jgi:hypothetical protein
VVFLATSPVRAAEPRDWALTGYLGRITAVNAWHDIVTERNHLEFANAYLATLALSRTLARYRQNGFGIETEGQVVYNFGDQSQWEFNAALASRWHRFPWNESLCHDIGVRSRSLLCHRGSRGRSRPRGFEQATVDLLGLGGHVRATRRALGGIGAAASSLDGLRPHG